MFGYIKQKFIQLQNRHISFNVRKSLSYVTLNVDTWRHFSGGICSVVSLVKIVEVSTEYREKIGQKKVGDRGLSATRPKTVTSNQT